MTFLTTKDLQDLIKVDKSTIYRMAEDGRLPAVKVGRQWRFPAEAVEAWLGGAPTGNGRRSPRLLSLLDTGVAQTVVDFIGDVLGVMAVLTDMDGEPITEVANPCGLFGAVADLPGVHGRCIDSWARYGAHPELVPVFRRSDFGFLCARTFVRSGSELLGMVIAGGVAREDWPPSPEEIRTIAATLGVEADLVAAHVDEVFRLDGAAREHVLAVLPRAGVLISNLVEDRQRHTGTLAAIADLADTRSRQ